MEFPSDRKYTKDHEWIKIDGNNATIGITEFAQSELGELVFVDLPAAGKEVEQGGTLCVVESTKAASDVYSPVAGKVIEANSKLSNEPALINSDPYGQGWIAKLTGLKSIEDGTLMDAAGYAKFLGSKA